MNFEVPIETPSKRKVKTAGVWLSGGTDSSLILYLLCKTIQQKGLDIRVQPMTVRKRPPEVSHGVGISKRIKTLLSFDKMNDHIVYYPKPGEIDDMVPSGDRQYFNRVNSDNFEERFEVLFSGVTNNPPEDVEIGSNGLTIRNPSVTKKEEILITDKYGIEHYYVDNFVNIDKKEVSRLYREEEIMESVFPFTRSCEHPTLTSGHCGECWWCKERSWGFGL